MIIIKSQCGGFLGECETIQCSIDTYSRQCKMDNQWMIIGNHKMLATYDTTEEDYVLLGYYESEEKCKEVISEIEHRSRLLKMYEIFSCDPESLNNLNGLGLEDMIFTMP